MRDMTIWFSAAALAMFWMVPTIAAPPSAAPTLPRIEDMDEPKLSSVDFAPSTPESTPSWMPSSSALPALSPAVFAADVTSLFSPPSSTSMSILIVPSAIIAPSVYRGRSLPRGT